MTFLYIDYAEPQRYNSPIRSPRRNPAPEEILIFCPDRNLQHQRHGDDRPVVRIPPLDSLASKVLVAFVQAPVRRHYDAAHFL